MPCKTLCLITASKHQLAMSSVLSGSKQNNPRDFWEKGSLCCLIHIDDMDHFTKGRTCRYSMEYNKHSNVIIRGWDGSVGE